MNGFLVDATGRALDLGEDVAGLLRRIGEQADPEALLARLAAATDALPEPVAALLPTSLSETDLFRFLARLEARVEDLESALRRYLATIDELPDEGVAWAWSSRPDAPLPASGSLTLQLGAEVGLSLRVLAPGPRYLLRGALAMRGSARLPFARGAAEAAGAGRSDVQVEVRFERPGDTRLAEAVAEDLECLGRLDEPQALAASSFERFSVLVTGELRLGAELELGRSWVSGPGRHGVTAEIEAGLRYALDWSRAGRYEIRVLRAGDDALRIAVEERSEAAATRTLTLGATVRLSGVEAAARPVLARLGALPEPVEALVERWGRPSALVRSRLVDRLPADARLRAFAEAVLGEGSTEGFVEELGEAVAEALEARADAFTELLAGELEVVTREALARLRALDADARAELEVLLEAQLATLSGRLRSELEDAIAAIVDDAGRRAALVGALEEIGERVEGALSELDTLTGRLLAPVARLLGRYRALLATVERGIAAVETEKLSAELARAVSESSDRECFLELELRGFGPDTVRLYRAMLRGDFADAIRAGADPANGEVTLRGSVFERTLARGARTTLAIGLFGSSLGWSRALTDRIRVRTDGGSLDLLVGEGAIEEVVTARRETQSLKLDTSVNFVDRAARVALAARYEDVTPSKRELREYLGALEASGLVATGAVEGLLGDEAFAEAVARQEPVALSTTLTLDRDQVRALAALGPERVTQIAILVQVDALRQVTTLRRALDRLRARFDADSAAGVIYALRGRSLDETKAAIGAAPGAVVADVTKARQMQMIGNSLANAAALVEFLVAFAAFLDRPAPPVVDGIVEAGALRALRSTNRRLAEGLDEWIEVPNLVQKAFSDRLSPWTLALFATLAELSLETGGRRTAPVTVVKWADGMLALPVPGPGVTLPA